MKLSRMLGLLAVLAAVLPMTAHAGMGPVDLTQSWVGPLVLGVFVLAYALVISEELLHLRKSKPVMVAAGLIWIFIAFELRNQGHPEAAGEAVRHVVLEFAEIFLFLLAAMTFVNVLEERQVFNVLRAWLISRGYTLRTMFWLTGLFAFCLSPVADNLTTGLLMGAVVVAVGAGQPRFIAIGCTNVVVAANAGGVFSPFGDVTTLMVWQKGHVHFAEFFQLILPAIVNWLVPAFLMSLAIPRIRPEAIEEYVQLRPLALFCVGLFAFTIALSVSLHTFLHLPPVIGMMTGLGLLKFMGYYLKRKSMQGGEVPEPALLTLDTDYAPPKGFDIFHFVSRAEWDTLMFFYGVVLCVGGLATVGWLEHVSVFFYEDLGATVANTLVGLLSAIIDNVPMMLAVLTMEPEMNLDQWLLVTLTAGVGGSLLSIGSAAGVALMGQARGAYTFFGHLRWSWAILIGYFASIATHLWLSGLL